MTIITLNSLNLLIICYYCNEYDFFHDDAEEIYVYKLFAFKMHENILFPISIISSININLFMVIFVDSIREAI